MADMEQNLAEDEDGGGSRDADLVLDEASKPGRVAERLRQAIKAAGGVGAVSAKSGVKSRTLTRLLGGQEAKQSALVALADACGVSLEWLATGRGPMRPEAQKEEQVAAGAPMPLPYRPPSRSETPQAAPATRPRLKLFASADMDRLAYALSAATMLFQARGGSPSWREVAQAVAIIYDLEEAGAPESEQAPETEKQTRS
jgi:hypothetical protein